MNWLQSLINRVFRMEEINGHNVCPTYLYRWTLLKAFGRGIYLHHFVGDDWSRDLHDHPRRFISIGLWGGYYEESEIPESEIHNNFSTRFRVTEYRAPWFRSFPAEHKHRLALGDHKTCWTLVVVLKNTRPWGFWSKGNWIPWRKYVNSDEATAAKSC